MLYLYLALILVLTIWGIRFSTEGDYLSKERCNSIKGIFILLIFLSHSLQYIKASGYVFSGIDNITQFILRFTGQLVVVMFLFYSGYGVALQVNRKGEQYVRKMPQHHILKTLLNFDIAVCFFILLALLLSRPLSINQVLLSFLAWDSVGNSNWYIFIILLCYIFTYIVNRISSHYTGWLILGVSIVAMLVLSCVKGTWWYDTILAYPAGYLYANYRQQVEPILKRYFFVILFILVCIFLFTHGHGPYLRGLRPNIMAVAFALIVVMLTMKIQVGNSWLQWFGTNLFPLYIYQRLPMIALQATVGDDFLSHYPIIYLFVCLLITCLITRYYKYWRI